jgi:hypothetical protein
MVPDPDALNAALRAEADRLLDSGLRRVLSSFGEMIVVGSYALEHPEYRRTVFSQDLYTAVLDHNVRDVDGFREFLRAR